MMKKISIVLAVVLFSAFAVYGQAPLRKGEKQLNAGIGFSDWGLPLYLGLDFGVHQDITVGMEGSFRSYSESWKGDYYSHNIFGFSGNGNYHFNTILQIPHDWDFYAGLNLGFYIWTSPSNYYGSHSSGLGLGGQVGARYFLNQKFGLNLEFGGGNAFSGGKFGITVKL
jgi:outer membrane immunogenic protein